MMPPVKCADCGDVLPIEQLESWSCTCGRARSTFYNSGLWSDIPMADIGPGKLTYAPTLRLPPVAFARMKFPAPTLSRWARCRRWWIAFKYRVPDAWKVLAGRAYAVDNDGEDF